MSEEPKRKRLSVRSWVMIAAGTIALGIIVMLITGRSDGPSYGGRSADDWLRGLTRLTSSPEITLEAVDYSFDSTVTAFEKMGTNGVLFLLGALERKDSAIASAYFRVLASLPAGLGERLPRPQAAADRARHALNLLSSMHDSAPDVTFPSIVQLLSSSSPQARMFAVQVIGDYVRRYRKLEVGSSRPAIIRALADTNLYLRLHLVNSLNQAGLVGSEAVAALQPLLTNADVALGSAARQALDQLNRANPSSNSHAP